MDSRTAADCMQAVVGMAVDSMVVDSMVAAGMAVDSMAVAGMGTDGMAGNMLDSVHSSLVVGRVGQMGRALVVDQDLVVYLVVVGGMVDRGVVGLVR